MQGIFILEPCPTDLLLCIYTNSTFSSTQCLQCKNFTLFCGHYLRYTFFVRYRTPSVRALFSVSTPYRIVRPFLQDQRNSTPSRLVRPNEKYTFLKLHFQTNFASFMQLSINSMEKLCFFAKEEPLEYLKAFFWHAFVDKCMLTSD